MGDTFAGLLYTVKKWFGCLLDYTFWCADNSAVSALIEMGLTQNESCVFWDHKVYICKYIIIIHVQIFIDMSAQKATVTVQQN